ncbi:putative formate/nitrite transporter [Boletus edulis BED1]|uniref:Formate/nitrite transporter n=1 Tax=Boletus edulis BED1 TaxID=1328754 RepID=A0AAD4GFW4_BOLED|nr:putative formate/nitrite transporter [Boletus edulis BED1]
MANVPSTLKPAETTVALIEMAVAKHNTRWDKTFFKAVMAGVMLSFGGLFDIIISGGSPGIAASNPGLVKLLGGFVFPVGLVMIVLQGFDLLTSNLMIFPMAAIKGAIPWWGIPVNWIIVTFGNLVGSLFFAAILAKYDGLTTVPPYLPYIQTATIAKAVTPAWYQIFLRGIGCNWLVCVAVWQSTAAKETISKVIATWFPIWVFVTCGFDHVVANMFSLPLGIMLHADLTTAEYIKKSLIASYIGNIIGGCLVGLPAVYFYLGDWNAGGLRNAEEAHVEKDSHTSSQ